MNIGIPTEVMAGENRIALTPTACKQLHKTGHRLFVQHNAGRASGYTDDEYQSAGCESVSTIEEVYAKTELVIKVKQPLAQDLACLKKRHTVFCYFHLAANHKLIQQLCHIGITAIPFESITDEHHNLPLLAPMSAIAGRIAVFRGASLLFKNRGGRGILLGGLDESHNEIEVGNVVIVGAGVAGSHAVDAAVNVGANIDVFDLDNSRLATLKTKYPQIKTQYSTLPAVAQSCINADLVIGAVLLAGRRAPVILKESTIGKMRQGSVIIDIAIDQGGCVENIEVTDNEKLFIVKHGVLQSAVPNMPAVVPRTASQALSNAILPYVHRIADDSIYNADIKNAIAIRSGGIVDTVLKQEIAA